MLWDLLVLATVINSIDGIDYVIKKNKRVVYHTK